MRKNIEKRRLARELRRQGFSLNEIKNKVNAAKSTVSVWVRDIVLSEEQLKQLSSYGPKKSGQASVQRAREIRKSYQEEGASLAEQFGGEPLFIGGCMLYWGEGAKNRNMVQFSNSDLYMHKYFLKFINKYFPDQKIKVSINCYTDIHSYEEILSYWSNNLDLEPSQFKKPQLNNSPKNSKEYSKNKQKLPYGTLHIKIHSTKLVQMLFGSIQKIAGFQNETWASM